MKTKLPVILALFCAITLWPNKPVFAFNLVTDVEEQTTFPIGQAASAGTAVNLRDGTLAASFLGEIANYRMLSAWYGGTYVNAGDKSLTDTAKIGLNLGYFLTGFVNKPPALLSNLVVGPSFAMSLISTPRKGTPFLDINYRFGGTTALPPAPTPSVDKTPPATKTEVDSQI